MSGSRLENPIYVALDTQDLSRALELARSVGPHVGGFKIGLEFISALGPEGIRAIVALGRPVFADVKFHDIPNTVAGASEALATLGVSIFNVHASGGEAMMRAAVDAVASANPRPKIIGVTVLTSLNDADLDDGRPTSCRRASRSYASRDWPKHLVSMALFAARRKSRWCGQPAALIS